MQCGCRSRLFCAVLCCAASCIRAANRQNGLVCCVSLRVQEGSCSASGGGSMQQALALASPSSHPAAAGFAQCLWELPFTQRVDLCCGMFRGLEPLKRTLQEYGACKHDGSALHTE